jgi:ferredoxin, 2Fe-2S
MAEITLIDRDGKKFVFDAENNRTLMEVIRDSGEGGLEAICGGCCSCATCHVYIDTAFSNHLPPLSEDEEILLEGSEHHRPDISRLSCQIRVTDALSGLVVEVAPEG